jgi:methionine-gamma-lyase
MANDPQTASVGEGHEASEHGWSLKTPIYETSAFVFETAEAGKRYFEVTYQGAQLEPGERLPFAYSRLDNPNLRVIEARMAKWEETDDALVFNSGMGAISTVFLSLLRPGDLVLHSSPVYGLTVTVLREILAPFGVIVRSFPPDASSSDLEALVGEDRLAMVYVETPANPTMDIVDIEYAASFARNRGALTVVDNTFLSPVLQKPSRHGADLVVHSATKYLGGHNDITAGVVCGGSDLIERLRHDRYRIGTTAQPHTASLLARSVETLKMRVESQTASATTVAAFLDEHPQVVSVNHLSLISPDDPRHETYKRQCLGPGAMISFDVAGGEEAAFRFLNAMKVVRLAVSLGGTESLAMHPWSTSHAQIPPEENMAAGITPGLVRLSIGVEAVEDLIQDLGTALDAV